MVRKKSKGIDIKKTIVIVVIVLVILFVLAMVYQGVQEDGEGLGTFGPGGGGGGMIHEWKFDGDLNDSIGRADKKEIKGEVEFVPGAVGLAVKLDFNDTLRALNRYLQDIPNNKFTLDFCMKAEEIRGNGMFIEKKKRNTGFAVRAKPNLTSGWAVGRPDNWVDCFEDVIDNQWHHVALTARKGENKSIWIDGSRCATNNANGPGLKNNRNFFQGRRLYKGLLDEEAIWNKVLSADEIRVRAEICKPVINVSNGGNVTNETTFKVEEDGNLNVEVSATLKDGNVSFNILFGNGSAFTGVGKAADKRLATTNSPNLTFYKKDSNGDDYHKYFIASYDGTNKESYLLRARITEDITAGRNTTDIDKKVGDFWVTVCEDRVTGYSCDIGDVSLRISTIKRVSGGEQSVVLNAGYNVVFYKVYDINEDWMQLPLESELPRLEYIVEINNKNNQLLKRYRAYWLKLHHIYFNVKVREIF